MSDASQYPVQTAASKLATGTVYALRDLTCKPQEGLSRVVEHVQLIVPQIVKTKDYVEQQHRGVQDRVAAAKDLLDGMQLVNSTTSSRVPQMMGSAAKARQLAEELSSAARGTAR